MTDNNPNILQQLLDSQPKQFAAAASNEENLKPNAIEIETNDVPPPPPPTGFKNFRRKIPRSQGATVEFDPKSRRIIFVQRDPPPLVLKEISKEEETTKVTVSQLQEFLNDLKNFDPSKLKRRFYISIEDDEERGNASAEKIDNNPIDFKARLKVKIIS